MCHSFIEVHVNDYSTVNTNFKVLNRDTGKLVVGLLMVVVILQLYNYEINFYVDRSVGNSVGSAVAPI